MRTFNNYDTTRVNYNLPSKLVERLKLYSESIGMPVTQTVTMLLMQSLESKKIIEEIPKLNNMYDDYKRERLTNSDTDSLI